MKLLKKFRELRQTHDDALARNEQAHKVAEKDGEVADALLLIATEQAKVLSQRNTDNHYSESLTYAFRGKTA